jgi:catechol 2,3-dioxygenase-like lactoylglutathione lyase family enzyme
MISHVFVGITDFDRALHFYSGLMEGLGFKLKFSEPENGWAGWVGPDSPRPLFLVGKPFDGRGAHPGNGNMVAFLARTRTAVDQAYAMALSMGGTCEGPPGLRPHYHPNYYGAYFRDSDGNKICVCCHDPAG